MSHHRISTDNYTRRIFIIPQFLVNIIYFTQGRFLNKFLKRIFTRVEILVEIRGAHFKIQILEN